MQPSDRVISEVPGSAVEAKAAKKAAKQAGRRVTWDKFCKCIPLVATVNTIFNMHQKKVYKEKIASVEDPKLADAYHQRIINDPTWQQVVLLVPVLGQIIVGISTAVESCCTQNKASTVEEPLADRNNFDRNVKYESSYPAENPGTPAEQLAMNDRLNQLEVKVTADTCSPEELLQLVNYATREEGRSAKAQYLLGMYFVIQNDVYGDAEQLNKARFWLDQAKTNHSPDAARFLDANEGFKSPLMS